MDNRKIFASFAVQAALGGILCTIGCMMFLGGNEMTLFYPLSLPVYAIVLYGLNALLLRRQRTVRLLSIINTVLFVGMIAFIFFAGQLRSLSQWVFALLFCICLTGSGIQMALQPPTLRTQLLYLDICAVLLVIFMAYLSSESVSFLWTAPTAASCAVVLLSIIVRRQGQPMSPRGWGILALSFLGLFGVMWLLVSFVAAPAGQGLVSLWQLFVRFLQFLLSLFIALLELISRLFPTPEAAEITQAPGISLPSGEEIAGEPSNVLVLLFLVLFCLAAIVLLIRLLRFLGKQRIGGFALGGKASASTRRLSLKEGLRQLLAQLKQTLRLRWFFLCHPNTPGVVFYTLVRRFRLTPWHMLPGQTPREFLCQLSRCAEGDALFCQTLEQLIPAVDAFFYAPPIAHEKGFPHARMLRRRARWIVHRQSLHRFFHRLKKNNH